MISSHSPFGLIKGKPQAHFVASETESQEGVVHGQRRKDLSQVWVFPTPIHLVNVG